MNAEQARAAVKQETVKHFVRSRHDRRRWWHKLARKLWPPRHDKWPDSLPQMKHGTVVYTDMRFSGWDRLRIFLSGRLETATLLCWNYTEKEAFSFTAIEIKPPLWADPTLSAEMKAEIARQYERTTDRKPEAR